jgi:hypothetical protein
MEILVKREWLSDECSIGELSIDGVFECFTLEDKDRGLTFNMPLAQIQQIKVYGQTAIPKGRYPVVIQFSEAHQKDLPTLRNVPGYGGVEMHPGNTAVDTLGCILVGQMRTPNSILNSVKAFNIFFPKLQAAFNNNEPIFITIQ